MEAEARRVKTPKRQLNFLKKGCDLGLGADLELLLDIVRKNTLKGGRSRGRGRTRRKARKLINPSP